MDGGEANAFGLELLPHPLVDRIQTLEVEEAAADGRLVGDDDESISRITKPPEAIRDPVQEDDARRIAQIAVVGDERVVSIKKDHRIHES